MRAFCGLIFFISTLQAQLTILHCGVLIDGYSSKPKKVVSIIIQESTIIDIADGYVDPGDGDVFFDLNQYTCLLYTSPSPRDRTRSRMPSSA